MNLRKIIRISVILTAVMIAVISHGGNQGDIPLGFVNCATVRAARIRGSEQENVLGLVVRFTDRTNRRESFGVSNHVGLVVVPLRPGKYCVDALDQNGRFVKQDPEQSRCFELKAGETITLGVVLDASQPWPAELLR